MGSTLLSSPPVLMVGYGSTEAVLWTHPLGRKGGMAGRVAFPGRMLVVLAISVE